jgi:hypothetical protein
LTVFKIDHFLRFFVALHPEGGFPVQTVHFLYANSSLKKMFGSRLIFHRNICFMLIGELTTWEITAKLLKIKPGLNAME